MRRLLAACLILSPSFLAIPAPAASSTIVISEFRARGPNGANDEFIELFNKSATTVNISGYKIMVSDASGTTSLLKQIPAATVMLPRHFYLLVNNGTQGYSGSTTPNTTYSVSIPDDGGIALFTSASVAVDEVGMLPAPGDGVSNAYVEGTGLDPFDPIAGNVNQSYERNNGGCAATHDTDDNAIDFRFNATTSNPQNSAFNCNTCVGVTCVSPPNNQCWTSPGTCAAGSCSYTQHAVGSACSDGDACTVGDACDGAGTCVSGPSATCTTPPAPFCSDPQTLVTPSSTGTCGAATGCNYTQTSQNCPFGCNGSTKQCNPDPCTNVSCTTPPNGCYAATGTCSGGTCIYAPLARNTPCSDGDACTTGDSCDGGGTCLPGASAVDDGNPCTTDGCAPSTGVVSHVPAADGTDCDDGDRCNGSDTCQAGACAAGTPVTCNTPPIGGCYSSPGVCNSANGACTYAPRSASATCDDGDPCTQSDQCDGNGTCGGSTVSCAANSVCLDSTTSRHQFGGACQSPSGTCGYSHADETCAFSCDSASGLCNQDPCLGVNCPAPDQCHVGVCAGGSCGAIAKATGSACDDGDPCTNSDECSGAGACSGTPLLCNAPPAPACVNGASRTYAALGTCAAGSCDYGTPTDAACSNGCDTASGLCNADPCATLTCDQADQCHIGTCNGVCDYTTPKPDGSNCDDGNPCTVQDSCTGGVCVGEAKACNAPPTPNCVDPNTSRTYDASTTCDAIQGACSAYPSHDTNCPTGCDAATGVCNGDPCASMICNTAPGSCFLATGTCAAGVCSYDFVSAGVSCDDGNACTSGDQCDGAGRCLGTPSCAPEGGLGAGGTSSADASTSLDGGPAAGGTANTDASVSAGGWAVDGGVPSSDASKGGSSANGGASNGAGGISAGASSGTGGASNGGEIGTLPDASRSDGAVTAAAAVQGDKGGCGCSIRGERSRPRGRSRSRPSGCSSRADGAAARDGLQFATLPHTEESDMADDGTPNQESIATWNEILVPKFLRFRHILVDGLSEHSKIPLAQFGPKPGDAVLDVGCGFGETTLELARAVGTTGRALGIDCASGFIDVAEADARTQGIRNATFRVADAQVEPFEQEFDFVFSRFGTMFFQSPVAALRNIRRGMKPGGRLLSVVWRASAENEWAALPKSIVQQYLPPPPDDGRSCGPGPFSMADPETTTAIFVKAGFSDVVFTKVDAALVVGSTLDEALAFQLLIGPAGEIVREAGDLAEQKRSVIERDLRTMLSDHMTNEGVVMESSSWAITARSA